MIHFLRLETLTLVAGGALLLPSIYAEPVHFHLAANPSELLVSGSSQGYLGVALNEVDNDRAAALKLKEARGAEIITIDQDAPASKAGLKVHDVVVQMNGQRVEGVEQLRRMLRETPPGRTVALLVMREGQTVNLSVQLADRTAIAQHILVGLDDDLPGLAKPEPTASALTMPPQAPSHRLGGRASSFLEPFSRNRYYVGVEVQPLTSQLADYFGVHNGSGVLVGNVFPNSPGSAAGLKAADIIQKVNNQPIVSLADWERAMRLNRGKQVQVMVIRDRHEQTLSMVAGEPKNSGELEVPDFIVPDLNLPDAQTLAELRIDSSALAAQVNDGVKGLDVESLRRQAEAAAAMTHFDADKLRREAEQAAHSIDVQNIDVQAMQKALEQSGKQLEINQKQIEEQLQQALRSLQLQQMD